MNKINDNLAGRFFLDADYADKADLFCHAERCSPPITGEVRGGSEASPCACRRFFTAFRMTERILRTVF